MKTWPSFICLTFLLAAPGSRAEDLPAISFGGYTTEGPPAALFRYQEKGEMFSKAHWVSLGGQLPGLPLRFTTFDKTKEIATLVHETTKETRTFRFPRENRPEAICPVGTKLLQVKPFDPQKTQGRTPAASKKR